MAGGARALDLRLRGDDNGVGGNSGARMTGSDAKERPQNHNRDQTNNDCYALICSLLRES
jgi:hypothetical protein